MSKVQNILPTIIFTIDATNIIDSILYINLSLGINILLDDIDCDVA